MKRLPFLALLLFAGTAAAQDPIVSESCIKGQYVMTRHPLRVLQDRAVQALEEVSPRELFVAEETGQATLVVEADTPLGEPLQPSDIVPGDRHNPCRILDKRKRLALREVRRAGLAGVVNQKKGSVHRDVSCSCNHLIEAVGTPNDMYLGYQWAISQMNMPMAWNMCTGSSSTIVAVIDTGIDYTHPDLQAAMWVNPGEIAGNGLDDDGNGVIDDIHGYNAINNSGNPFDDNGHGTHVGGTIGASTNNSIGVAGIAWNVRLMAVKFLGASGNGQLFDAIKSLNYVVDLKRRGINISITNNSWGYQGGRIAQLEAAIQSARDNDILFVAAAGNSGINMDASPQYPASYPVSNVISVSAVDSSGNLASFSNYGGNSAMIAAPGVSIASTYPNKQYVYLQGTSMAAPHVAGALALLESYRPSLSGEDLKRILLESARYFPTLSGKVIGGRFVDAYQMLLAGMSAPTPGPTATPIPPTATPLPTATNTPAPTPTPLPPTATPLPTATPIPVQVSVSGLVTSATGVPVAGARVNLRTAYTDLAVYTGPDGKYQFSNVLGPVAFTMTAQASGLTFTSISGYLNSDRTVDLRSAPNRYLVSAAVRNAQGQSLPNARVTLGTGESAVTDGQGRVSFSVDYGESYSLSAAADGYIMNTDKLEGTVFGNVERIFIAKSS